MGTCNRFRKRFLCKKFLHRLILKAVMSSRTTLKKISRLLNISISTVSRALKNHPDISEATKIKVKEAAAMLDYEPNTMAINLRADKSNLIGLIVPYIFNFFYQSFIAAVEENARKNNYSLLILQSADSPETELENLRICRANRVAAVLVCLSPGTKDIGPFLRMREAGTPVIFFDKVPAYEACDKVCIADAEAAACAAAYILQKKKKNILGLFGNPAFLITQKRLDAFRQVFEKNKGTARLTVMHAASSLEAEQKLLSVLRKQVRPDTVFSMSDEILCGVMKALQLQKIKIPSEIALISISNDGFIPRLFEPEITYVETSGYELGILAFKRITEYLEGRTFVQELLLSPRLVTGKSL